MKIECAEDDGLVTLLLDDGGSNLLDAAAIHELILALNDAQAARAIVLAGREGTFTDGLNLEEPGGMGNDQIYELYSLLGRTLMRIWAEPRPMVAACTGDVIGAGVMLAMACDHAVAADGDYAWDLCDARKGVPLPEFAITLARYKMRSDQFDELLLAAETISPAGAVEAGFAGELAPPAQVVIRATARARTLAALPRQGYAYMKRRLRGGLLAGVLSQLDSDVRLVADNCSQSSPRDAT